MTLSYLCLITDVYSHQIMGWALEPTLHTKGPLSALQIALRFKGKGKKELIIIPTGGCSTAASTMSSYSVQRTSASA
jgi:hypothetical protein